MITSHPRSGCIALTRRHHGLQCLLLSLRSFTSFTASLIKSLPPRPTLPDSDLHHVFLKGSGPGGQKINKTNSAVQLTHKPTGIVVKSQATRSQSQNYKIARQILAEKIEHQEKGPESRFAIKVERKGAKKRSREKKAKRKYRALDEAKHICVKDDGRGQAVQDSVRLGSNSDGVSEQAEVVEKLEEAKA